METRASQDLIKKMSDQLRVSLVQVVVGVLGAGWLGKFLDGNITIDKLEPTGYKISIRCSIDVYPDKTSSPA